MYRSVGNTPAYAGKTPSPEARGDEGRKHPRLRGEDGGRRVLPPLMGKHPRLRGEDPRVSVFCGSSSETPPLTRGRRSQREAEPRSRQKHPRLRGEDQQNNGPVGYVSETPPLTRGRPASVIEPNLFVGNTPAYAGKTRHQCLEQRFPWKHPRLRGEDCGSFY